MGERMCRREYGGQVRCLACQQVFDGHTEWVRHFNEAHRDAS